MPDSPDTCGRKPNPQRKSCGFQKIRIRCGRAREYSSPTTYRAGAAVVSTASSYIFIYVSKHVLVACRLKTSITFFFFSLFFVAFQRPLVNEPELNNQLNNDLRLRAVMIVYIEVERSYVTHYCFHCIFACEYIFSRLSSLLIIAWQKNT